MSGYPLPHEPVEYRWSVLDGEAMIELWWDWNDYTPCKMLGLDTIVIRLANGQLVTVRAKP